MVLIGSLYRRIVHATVQEVNIGLRMASLFFQDIYNVCLVEDCKSSEWSKVFSQSELLKPIFDHDFLVVALHHVLEATGLLEGSL